jgi:hypothetical protein
LKRRFKLKQFECLKEIDRLRELLKSEAKEKTLKISRNFHVFHDPVKGNIPKEHTLPARSADENHPCLETSTACDQKYLKMILEKNQRRLVMLK